MSRWSIWFYNSVDAEFGFDCGAHRCMTGLDKATAKSIARHKNKVAPDFVSYWAEEDMED